MSKLWALVAVSASGEGAVEIPPLRSPPSHAVVGPGWISVTGADGQADRFLADGSGCASLANVRRILVLESVGGHLVRETWATCGGEG